MANSGLTGDSRVRYAVEILLGEPGVALLDQDRLAYAEAGKEPATAALVIRPSGFFTRLYGSPGSLPELPLPEFCGLPILYGRPLLERVNGRIILHADLLASAYFLTTRYEEWIRPQVRDVHGRFPGRSSLPYRAGFLHRPIVDEYAAKLRELLASAGVSVPPPEREFSVLLTHDVDTLGPRSGPVALLKAFAKAVLWRQRPKEAFQGFKAALGLARHPYDNLAEVLERDRSLLGPDCTRGGRSIWFFMAGGRSPYDGAYSVLESRLRRNLQFLLTSGADIGLHASYSAGIDPGLLHRERKALEAAAGVPICKNRHHFLAWREPQHGAAIAAAGIRWDSTLGYADVAGFRLGVCRPIPLFDPIRHCLLGIEEHPLIVMDCTLDRKNYMGLSEEEAFDYVCRLADTTYRHQGELVLLWHNTQLASGTPWYHRRLYDRILERLAGLRGTPASG
jgi:hypothetical protein